MRKKLIAIALSLFCVPALPQNSHAQVETAIGAGACATSGVCGVIVGIVFLGGVGYYVLNANGRKFRVHPTQMEIHPQPIVQPGPRPEMQMDERPGYNEPGVETHAAASPQHCKMMEQRFLMQGRKLKLNRIRRTATPGLRYDCEFIGPDARPGWFHDRRGGR